MIDAAIKDVAIQFLIKSTPFNSNDVRDWVEQNHGMNAAKWNIINVLKAKLRLSYK